MCIANAEEVALNIGGWAELFPHGFPDCYMYTDSPIDIEAWLPNIERGCVRAFKQWATSKNAERAQRPVSCHPSGVFPLLNAIVNQRTLFPIEPCGILNTKEPDGSVTARMEPPSSPSVRSVDGS